MRTLTPLFALLATVACVEGNPAEDPADWFDPGAPRDVEEPIAFTDVNYDFPADPADGIGDALLSVMPGGEFASPIHYAPDDFVGIGGCSYTPDPALPVEVEGVVTLHPRFYYKTQGCDRDSDEKYYGSYFIQDATGGVFVLGDSKVAHFDVGDRVRLRVRGVRTVFGLDMVYAHDVVSVDRSGEAVYYEQDADPLCDDDIGVVKRVTGTVVSEPDTFGQFAVKPDEAFTRGCDPNDPETAIPEEWFVQLDSEITRRGVTVEVGDRVQATGPVLFSYDIHSIVIMRVGQLAVLD